MLSAIHHGITLREDGAWHAAAMDGLPSHHSDPFDRMLVAQALAEGIKFVSHDDKIAKYGDVVVVV